MLPTSWGAAPSFGGFIWTSIFIPNRTFLVRFGGISGEFGRTMSRRSRAKVPMVRPNEPDMLPKRTKKVRLGVYRTQIRPKIRTQIRPYGRLLFKCLNTRAKKSLFQQATDLWLAP